MSALLQAHSSSCSKSPSDTIDPISILFRLQLLLVCRESKYWGIRSCVLLAFLESAGALVPLAGFPEIQGRGQMRLTVGQSWQEGLCLCEWSPGRASFSSSRASLGCCHMSPPHQPKVVTVLSCSLVHSSTPSQYRSPSNCSQRAPLGISPRC